MQRSVITKMPLHILCRKTYGSEQPVNPRVYNDGSESYNGYSIQPSVLIEEFDLEKVEEKKRKIEETKLEMERLQNELDALNKGIGNF